MIIKIIFLVLSVGTVPLFSVEAPSTNNVSNGTYNENEMWDGHIPTLRKTVRFDLFEKPLLELIKEISQEKKINILLPQGSFEIPKKMTVTFRSYDLLTIDEAWNQVIKILDLAGYVVMKENDLYVIKKNDQNTIKRSVMSIYINEPIEQLPDTEEIVRVVHYLENLNPTTHKEDLTKLMKELLSPSADFRIDEKTNSLILTDKAINIKNLLKIIQEIDNGGVRDQIEIIQLFYTSSKMIEDLFKKLIDPRTVTETSYFPKNTKILSLERTNSVVIMGTERAIDVVRDFIIKYLDKPMDSGDSILHVYELQYLQAEKFAPVLSNIINQGKSEQASGKITSGPKQYFQDVIISFERVQDVEQLILRPTQVSGDKSAQKTQVESKGVQLGGNRLIVAARNKDWIRIKSLIQYLDKPQPQVGIDVLVIDISTIKNKLIGTQMRNKLGFNNSISDDVNYQSAQLSPPILIDGSPVPPNALMSNLLQLGSPFLPTQNIANTATPGSLILTLNDSQTGGVWGVLQVLNNYVNTTILAQPFLYAQNHKQATATIAQERLLAGDADSSSVAVTVKREWVKAALVVDIVPHISGLNINLQVTITVDEFIGSSSNTRINRVIQTNANLGNGQILALGGLTRNRTNLDKSGIPILQDLPGIGFLFRKTQVVTEKNNLLILICPTIIEPRLSGGMDQYTKNKIEFAKNNIEEQLNFQNLSDPVTHFFFKPNRCQGKAIDEYTQLVTEDSGESSEIKNSEVIAANQSVVPQQSPQSKKSENEQLKSLAKNMDNPLTHHRIDA